MEQPSMSGTTRRLTGGLTTHVADALIHGFKRQRWIFLSGIAAVGVVLVLARGAGALGTGWWQWFEPVWWILSITVTCAIWLGENLENWEATRPMTLTALFEYGGKVVLLGEDVPLAGEADIRALGQQIGKSMNDDRLLALDLYTRPIECRIDGSGAAAVRRFTVRFGLREVPEKFRETHQAGRIPWARWTPASHGTDTRSPQVQPLPQANPVALQPPE